MLWFVTETGCVIKWSLVVGEWLEILPLIVLVWWHILSLWSDRLSYCIKGFSLLMRVEPAIIVRSRISLNMNGLEGSILMLAIVHTLVVMIPIC